MWSLSSGLGRNSRLSRRVLFRSIALGASELAGLGFLEPGVLTLDVDLAQDRRVQRRRRRLAAGALPIALRGHLLDHLAGAHRLAALLQDLRRGFQRAHLDRKSVG